MQDYYKILGVERNYPQDKIAHAFRIKIKQVHPDKTGIVDDEYDSKEVTIKLYQAYKILNDPESRKNYDQKIKFMEKSEEISSHRYFEETNLIEEKGKWYAECQQCMGKTQISVLDHQKIKRGDKNFFVKCWHCNLPLQLFVQE